MYLMLCLSAIGRIHLFSLSLSSVARLFHTLVLGVDDQ